MSATGALHRGFLLAARRPRLALLLWLLQLLAAVPFTWVLGDALHHEIAERDAHRSLDSGFDLEWFSEYSQQAGGVERSFEPGRVLGAAPFLHNLEGAWLGTLFSAPPWLLAAGGVFGFVWLLGLAGCLTQLVEPTPQQRFRTLIADGAHHWGRFIRLALLTAPLYFGLFALGRWSFGFLQRRTADFTREATVLALYLAAAAGLALALLVLRTVGDLARVVVARDDRGVLGALRAASVFLLRRPLASLSVARLPGAIGLLVVPLYALLVPDATAGSWLAIGWTFLVAQASLASRLWLRVAALAATVELFRDSASTSPRPGDWARR